MNRLNAMKKTLIQISAGVMFGGAMAVASPNPADLKPNQIMIGDEVIDGVASNGIIYAHKWTAVSNALYDFQFIIDTRIKAPPGALVKGDSKRVLQTWAVFGPGNSKNYGNVISMYGLMHVSGNWRMPPQAQTNLIDVVCSEDKTKIAVMVCDNGPIFYSTNSGTSWDVITKPRKERYYFPLVVDSERYGWYAAATIHPQSQKPNEDNPLTSSWYAVGTASDGSEMVVSGNASHLAPILSIGHADNEIILSWSSEATDFIPQKITDLVSTNWVDLTNTVNIVSNQFRVVIPATGANYFYRLKSQTL